MGNKVADEFVSHWIALCSRLSLRRMLPTTTSFSTMEQMMEEWSLPSAAEKSHRLPPFSSSCLHSNTVLASNFMYGWCGSVSGLITVSQIYRHLWICFAIITFVGKTCVFGFDWYAHWVEFRCVSVCACMCVSVFLSVCRVWRRELVDIWTKQEPRAMPVWLVSVSCKTFLTPSYLQRGAGGDRDPR